MKLFENHSLKDFNTFRLNSTARYFAEVELVDDLLEIQNNPELLIFPRYFLGNGSNLLLSDRLEGLVIHNSMSGIRIKSETEDFAIIEADGGTDWHHFVKWCTENGYYGLENLALIPGSVGAAPVQNIGAYGVEQKDYFLSCEVYDFQTGWFLNLNNAECGFEYRFSNFKKTEFQNYYVTKVRYKLPKKFSPNIIYKDLHIFFEKNGIKDWHELSAQKVFEAICEIRTGKLPNVDEFPNAGSFFKNPIITQSQYDKLLELFPYINFFRINENVYKASAAFLIEKAGWKGRRTGDAGVSDIHSLILVNYGNSTGEEMVNLSKQIIESVNEKFGILLEPEIIIW